MTLYPELKKKQQEVNKIQGQINTNKNNMKDVVEQKNLTDQKIFLLHQQAFDVFFCPGDAHAFFGDLANGGKDLFFGPQFQKGSGMALSETGFTDGRQNGIAVAEQPQLVGHSALAFSQQTGGLFLGHGMLLQQPPDPQSFLDEVQILPLQIFHQSGKPGFPGIHIHDDAGNIGNSG